MRAKVKEEEAEGGDDGRRREGCSRQRAARLSSSPSSPASRWKIRERERRTSRQAPGPVPATRRAGPCVRPSTSAVLVDGHLKLTSVRSSHPYTNPKASFWSVGATRTSSIVLSSPSHHCRARPPDRLDLLSPAARPHTQPTHRSGSRTALPPTLTNRRHSRASSRPSCIDPIRSYARARIYPPRSLVLYRAFVARPLSRHRMPCLLNKS